MKQIIYLLFFICMKSQAMDIYCNGAPTTHHENGGGSVALTAIVDPSVYVGPNASVCEYATVLGNTQINDQVRVYGYARIYNGTIIEGSAEVFGNATLTSKSITEFVRVLGNAKIYGNANLVENATVNSNAKVFESARVSGNAIISDSSQVFGNATITGDAQVKGSAKIHGSALLGQNIIASGTTDVCLIKHYPANTILENIINCPGQILFSTTQVSAGGNHTCGVLSRGSVRCWGANTNGELGTGDLISIGDNELPVTSKFIATDVSMISSGIGHTCSLTKGNVRCWGSNVNGQLGYGNNTNLLAPGTSINLGTSAIQIATGNAHTCALLSTGAVRCWGSNSSGQLGNGTYVDQLSPGSDINLGGIAIQVAAGYAHTCALLSTGTVKCWGSNNNGELGYSNTVWLTTPGGDINLGGIATQITTGNAFTCALLTSGAVRCWGYGGDGRVGYGNTSSVGAYEHPSAVGDVNLGGVATQISAGLSHVCALLNTGTVRCWGSNSYGQLGYGNLNNVGDNEYPSAAGSVSFGGTATKISSGMNHTCVLLDTREIRCWGNNEFGQLGYGNTISIGDNELPSSVGSVINQFAKNKKSWRKNEY